MQVLKDEHGVFRAGDRLADKASILRMLAFFGDDEPFVSERFDPCGGFGLGVGSAWFRIFDGVCCDGRAEECEEEKGK
jgi:hypothetical protein